jgi:hypothetical protein
MVLCFKFITHHSTFSSSVIINVAHELTYGISVTISEENYYGHNPAK